MLQLNSAERLHYFSIDDLVFLLRLPSLLLLVIGKIELLAPAKTKFCLFFFFFFLMSEAIYYFIFHLEIFSGRFSTLH